MMSEPKIEAEKGAFRFPALVSLAPKRRFKANPPANEETMQLDEERVKRELLWAVLMKKLPGHYIGKDSNDLVASF